MCPYCGSEADRHQFLTGAQRKYVAHYCETLNEAQEAGDGDYTINMDEVADATASSNEKPPFYYSELRRQNLFTCDACGARSDILGIYGYCSVCGTRNDLQELKTLITQLHKRISDGAPPETCVRDAVACFDSFVKRFAELLLSNVPLTPARRHLIEKRSLHDLARIVDVFKSVFDIDLSSGITDKDMQFAKRMFFRRHVYEHSGGEVDQQYIDQSGDKSVLLRQAIREDGESAHRIATIVQKLTANLHWGFHQIFPPNAEVIRRHADR